MNHVSRILMSIDLFIFIFLQRFESFMDLEDDWTLLSVPYCFEYSLKSFCVSDFLGLEQHIQFIKFVLKNARVLEEIRIVCSSDILTDRDNIKSQLEAVVPKSCLMTFLQTFLLFSFSVKLNGFTQLECQYQFMEHTHSEWIQFIYRYYWTDFILFIGN